MFHQKFYLYRILLLIISMCCMFRIGDSSEFFQSWPRISLFALRYQVEGSILLRKKAQKLAQNWMTPQQFPVFLVIFYLTLQYRYFPLHYLSLPFHHNSNWNLHIPNFPLFQAPFLGFPFLFISMNCYPW
jgi:hypothetical protein